MSRISSWVRRSPSTSAWRKWLSRSSRTLAGPLVDDLLEVRVDRVGRLLLVRLGLGVAELVADDLVGPDRRRPSSAGSVGRSSIGSPNIVRNTCDGNGVENRAEKSISSSSTNPSMRSLTSWLGRLLEQLHPLRREQRVEELAVLPVVRRVDLQRDQRPLRLQVVRRRARREHVGMPEHLVDAGPRADDHADAVEAEHRRARLQHRVDRLRVPGHLRVHQLRQPGAVALVPLRHGRSLALPSDRMFGLRWMAPSGRHRPATRRGTDERAPEHSPARPEGRERFRVGTVSPPLAAVAACGGSDDSSGPSDAPRLDGSAELLGPRIRRPANPSASGSSRTGRRPPMT